MSNEELEALMPQYEQYKAIRLVDDEAMEQVHCVCGKVLGKRSKETNGKLALWCKACKEEVTCII